MNESKKYLGFFKKNLLIFFILSLVGAAGGFYIQNIQPAIFVSEQLFELKEAQKFGTDPAQSMVVLDHLITLARSQNLRPLLGVDQQTQISLVRFSPYGFKLSIASTDPAKVGSEISKIASYVKDNFNSKNSNSGLLINGEGGSIFYSRRPNVVMGVFMGFTIGIILALGISLMKTYLEKY